MIYDIASVILIIYLLCLLTCAIIAFYEAYFSDEEPIVENIIENDLGDNENIGLSNALGSSFDTNDADDLQRIKGVGPKLEGVLHAIGVYTFRQISQWSEADVAKVDTHLKFSGRIDRDEWIKQAKEFSN